VIFLDKRNRLISCQEMFQGTIDGASVHPREVVKEALKQSAAFVILAPRIRAGSQNRPRPTSSLPNASKRP
jgi:DNA repair protein RadC